MILVCPRCKASYLVPASIFSSGGRKVRCARCGNDWFADLPSRLTVMPEQEPPPLAESAPPPVAASEAPPPNLPALWKAPREKLLKIAKYVALVLALLSFVGLAALSVKPIMGLVSRLRTPAAEKQINAAPGFSMQQVRSERRFQDGGMQLLVEGVLAYDGSKSAPVPDLRATALGPDRKPIKEWTIPAPQPTLEPGQSVSFSSAVNTPEGTVVEVNLSFLPPSSSSAHDKK